MIASACSATVLQKYPVADLGQKSDFALSEWDRAGTGSSSRHKM
jgi:hypothetical protein